MKYKYDIELFITHPNDVLSLEGFDKQLEMFNESMNIINNYRTNNGLNRITKIHYYDYSDFNANIDPAKRKFIQTEIEYSFVKDKEMYDKQDNVGKLYDTIYDIDYFITTVNSTHQSHRACNNIAITCMRSPYIEKCKQVLFATYPQDEFGISYDNKPLNSFIPLNQGEVDILCHCIGNVYGSKNYDTTILGADNFSKYLSYFGSKCGKKYAQPFSLQRRICTIGMTYD